MCIASKVGNVVDIAKEAIDHGKVSVPFLMSQKDTSFYDIIYLLQRVNYRIIVTQIKVVFSQSKCNQSAPTSKDYYQSELYSISNE